MMRRASCFLLSRQRFASRSINARNASNIAASLTGSSMNVRHKGYYQNSNDKKNLAGVLQVAAAVALASGSVASGITSCDASPTQTPKEESVNSIKLWPNGVDEADVDALVDEVLNDPSLNSPMIPDLIERQLYKSTIQLTMNMAYYVVSSIEGMELLAHKVHINSKEKTPIKHFKLDPSLAKKGRGREIDEDILEAMAERLLQNSAVNLKMVPDALEKQVYINCLKVFFRILAVISQSMCITICGHQLKMQLEPMETKKALEKALSKSSSLSEVDMEHMYQFAREAGIQDDELAGGSWWARLFIRKELLAHLHASLYALMVGIADECLANTKIRIMSDELGFEVRPDERYDPVRKMRVTDDQKQLEKHAKEIQERDSKIEELEAKQKRQENKSVGAFGTATFLAGIGVGVSVTAMMMSSSSN